MAKVTVTDAEPQDDAATFELAGGVDAAMFSIDGATGVLSFKAAPDHELPLDVSCGGAGGAGGNVYLVTVRATSGVDAQPTSRSEWGRVLAALPWNRRAPEPDRRRHRPQWPPSEQERIRRFLAMRALAVADAPPGAQ